MIEENRQGVTQVNLNTDIVREIHFPFAPRNQQQRIVQQIEALLSDLDAAVASLKRVQANLKRYRASVLKAACEGDIGGFDARRWTRVRVSDVAEVRLGRQRSPANRPGQYARPYFRAANVTWAGLDLSDVKEMDFRPSEVERYELATGDVLLSEASGSASEVGKPVVYRGEIPGVCFQNTLIRVRSRGPTPEFLKYRFLHDALAGRFASASKGVGIHHLGAERLSALEFLLPPLREQAALVREIDRRLSEADAQQDVVASNLKRASRLRAAVLSAAFRGQLATEGGQ